MPETELASAGRAEQERYDLLLKGGHVIDPKNGLSGVMDLAVRGGRIARVAKDVHASTASQVIDLSGYYVTPGLIDIHVHVDPLDTPFSVVADGQSYTVNGDSLCSNGETEVCGESDVGVCQLGIRTCTAGVWGTCEGAVYPTTEICDNGLDDDCDGWTDLDDASCSVAPTSILITQVAYDTPGDDSLEEFVDIFNTPFCWF